MKNDLIRLGPCLCMMCVLTQTGWAQSDLVESEAAADAAESAADAERPGEVVFEPPARAGDSVLEEIIVYGEEDEWRLPDLGDSLRREREELERQDRARVKAEFLPLYDPEQPEPDPDLFRMFDAEKRVGKIELFRIRFGGQ